MRKQDLDRFGADWAGSDSSASYARVLKKRAVGPLQGCTAFFLFVQNQFFIKKSSAPPSQSQSKLREPELWLGGASS